MSLYVTIYVLFPSAVYKLVYSGNLTCLSMHRLALRNNRLRRPVFNWDSWPY